jgi:hypothetical protein
VLILAVSVRGIEEAVDAVCHELSFHRQALQRFVLEDAFVAAEIVENLRLADEEAGVEWSLRT